MRTLEEWLEHQSRVHPQTIDLGLERPRAVLERLGWRRPPVPVITVAGTNGKGSVTAYCAAMLQAAGLRAGTFTSPHLRDYRERIRVADEAVRSADLVAAFERIEAARGATPLTFFEYNALAAFLILEAARLDAWVLEIGLGGRLDAVNLIDPSVAVIVSIGLDHQEYLGPTLEDIAREKAGIFRAGSPALLGNADIPRVAADIARDVGAPLKRLGTEYRFTQAGSGWHYHGTRWDLARLPAPALFGDTQFGNAATAIAALEELHGLPRAITPAAVARGLETVRLTGRFQIIAPQGPNRPTWILDVAHNPDAARVLAANLRALPCAGRTLAVCGILADKDAGGIAVALGGCIDEWWLAATDGARGISAASLAQRLALPGTVPLPAAAGIDGACAAALAAAGPGDRVVVFGSFHTVGPALDWLDAHGLLPPGTMPAYT